MGIKGVGNTPSPKVGLENPQANEVNKAGSAAPVNEVKAPKAKDNFEVGETKSPRTKEGNKRLASEGYEDQGAPKFNFSGVTRGPVPLGPNDEPMNVGKGAPTSAPAGLSETDKAQVAKTADEILGNPNEREGAQKLAEALDKAPSKAHRTALIKQMTERAPNLAAKVFSAPSQLVHFKGDLSKAQGDLIAGALGEAYDAGALDKAGLQKLLDPKHHGAHNNPVPLADVIANSHSSKLQSDAAKEMYAIADKYGETTDRMDAYYAGAAKAASGSPTAAKALLDGLGGSTLENLLRHTSPKGLRGRGDLTGKPILSDLLNTAAKVTPPSDGTNRFFDRATRYADNDPATKQALAGFFKTHTQDITNRLAQTSGNTLENRATLVKFAENVLFSDPFKGQQELRTAFGHELSRRVVELRSGPKNSSPESEEKARQLGALLGSAEVGFRRALENIDDENAAREGFAGFLFDAVAGPVKGAIPYDINIPGVGSVKDKAADAVKEELLDWVKKDKPSVDDLVKPLLQLGFHIPSDYVDEMESVAGRFHDQKELNLLN